MSHRWLPEGYGRDGRLLVGMTLPQFQDDADEMIAAASDAEDVGIDGVFLFDHLFPLGRTPGYPAMECIASAAAVASQTRRVIVGTLVVRSTLRLPAVAAASLRSVDQISGGRLVAGLGTGDHLDAVEGLSYGLPVPTPGERLSTLERLLQMIDPEIPVWIGGVGKRVRQIAGRVGTAWNRWGGSPEQIESEARVVIEAARDAGREPPALTWGGQVVTGPSRSVVSDRMAAGGSPGPGMLIGTYEEVAASIRALARAGVEFAVLSPVRGTGVDDLARLTRLL